MPVALIFGFVAVAVWILFTSQAKASQDVNECSIVTNSSSNGFAINNPLNLRFIAHNPWTGQVGNHNGYGVYSSLSLGVRAGGKQATKDFINGNNTLRKLINVWAPPTENDTQSYLADVSQRTGIDPDVPLTWPAADGGGVGGDQPDVIAAMIIHENGYNSISADDLLNYLNS